MAENYERVLDIVMKEDDLNWKELLMNLVREESMDPWNINVTLLAERFLKLLSDLKEMDFRVSGKMVLAASLLLKIKSDRLLLDDLAAFDNMLAEPVEDELPEFIEDEPFDYSIQAILNDEQKIVPRTPQPRERQVSVFDLVNALEQALAQDVRRQNVLRSQSEEVQVQIPRKIFDLTETMNKMSNKLKSFFTKKQSKVLFNDLLLGQEKEDKVHTFIPLLHMENARQVDLFQEKHFDDIHVTIHHDKVNADE